ncbi:uncharacterized protein B0I36DRAFT_347694 [Microdochium trichocladiopsis]|uniref:CBM-cenC domain-containing protein n=1 Tax=Microdochium trichocladiopsis TaxID=1682393 RepID=A0A9P9BTZ8_9PEZI|nr:uncharacterized protein B0I36DRAFT_347694 [Microdochium trichocladiopsis]KAH7035987.1 hypothetical protein B0I36DRAFT_347694 [Microdochium trichocladiopsis]
MLGSSALRSVVLLCAAIATIVSAATVPRHAPPQGQCCPSKCLRALQETGHEQGKRSFCKSLLETEVPPHATIGLPAYLAADCGPPPHAARLSKACSCFMPVTTTASTTTSSTARVGTLTYQTITATTSTGRSSGSRGNSYIPVSTSTATTTTTSSISHSDISSTCSAPTATVTLPASTVTLPWSNSTCGAATVTIPASTVTVTDTPTCTTSPPTGSSLAFPDTSTCTATTVTSTITLPASTPTQPPPTTCTDTTVTLPDTTVTLPASTVTLPASTVTQTTPGPVVTVRPTRSCTQPLDESGFEAQSSGLYPWLFAAVSVGATQWGWGLNSLNTPGSHWPPGSGGKPHSGSAAADLHLENPTPGSAMRFWQPFAACAGPTTYQLRIWYGTNRATTTDTLTIRARIFVSAPGFAAGTNPANQVYDNTQIVSTLTFDKGGWAEIVFSPWSYPGGGHSGVLYLDISTSASQSFVTWFDDITLSAV